MEDAMNEVPNTLAIGVVLVAIVVLACVFEHFENKRRKKDNEEFEALTDYRLRYRPKESK